MSKKVSLPQSRRHLFIYDEDWEYLSKLFGANSPNSIGVSAAVRAIIHAKVKQLRQREIDERENAA